MANDIGGVWRTVGGRRIFIKNGQDLASAMKESGKFEKEKQILVNKIEKQINDIQIKIDKIENSKEYFWGSSELSRTLDKLYNKRSALQKKALDEKPKNDKNFIQDKELRDYIYDYTNGDYGIACLYTQYLADGLSEKDSYSKTNYYRNSGIYEMSANEFRKKIDLTKKLSVEIDAQKEMDKVLIRFEKTQTDSHYNDVSRQYKIGEEINWGIRSTSFNEDYFNKVMSGNDKIKSSSLMSVYPYTYTEYRIIGNKKGLDISKYSQYKDQDEVLVKGKFIVKNVEKVRPNYVYDTEVKTINFKEWLKQNEYTFIERISKKSGKKIIEIIDKNGKVQKSDLKSHFIEKVNCKATYEEIINGKVPYIIEEIKSLNREKSSTDIIERQIVTLEQKAN